MIAERLLELREPGQVALSPDGTQVCFVVTAAAAEPGQLPGEQSLVGPARSRWAVEPITDARPAPTGSPGMVTRRRPDRVRLGPPGHPGRFSPQLLTVAGLASRPVGEVLGTIEQIEWTADGSELLVLAADLGADGAGSEGAKRIDSGADPWVKRPAAFWRRLYRVARDGSTLEVPLGGVNVWEFAVAASGQVAGLVSDDPAEDAWYDGEVAVIGLADGAVRPIRDPRRQTASVAASPGGNRVAFVEGLSSDRGLVSGTVHVVDLETGEVSELPAGGEDVTFVGWRDDASLWVAGWRSLGSVCGILTLSDEYEEVWGGDAFVGEGFGASFAATGDGSLRS